MSDEDFADQTVKTRNIEDDISQESIVPQRFASVDVKGTAIEVKNRLDFNVEVADDDDADGLKYNYRNHRLSRRLTVDHPFRRRFFHSVWLFLAFFGLGWMVGQMGPSFPDLIQVVQEDLHTASWLFTIFSIGYVFGSFLGGVLYDRCNKFLLIAISTLVMGIFTGAIPWCKQLPVMLVVRFLAGLGAGGLDTGASIVGRTVVTDAFIHYILPHAMMSLRTGASIAGGNAELLTIWDEEGRPYLQALHFCFGVGGILSPIVSQQFLAKKECLPVGNLTVTRNYGRTVDANTTLVNITACQEQYGETNVQFAYLISFVIIIISAIPFFVTFCIHLCSETSHTMIAMKSDTDCPDKLETKLKVVLLILLFLFMFMYSAIEDTFAGLLATFCLDYLNWDKTSSSYATSSHWAAFSIGRFFGIFLISHFKSAQLLFTFCVFLIAALTGFLIVSIMSFHYLIWLFIPLAGFAMSVIFPCIFTWTEESILRVTGMISSGFLIAASSGLMINPLFVSSLMNDISPLYFVYVLLAESCCCLLICLTIWVVVKKFVKHNSNKVGVVFSKLNITL